MPSLGPAEILVILVVALLVFGPNKMPDIARQVGKGMREFKRVQQHLSTELRDVVAEFDGPTESTTTADATPTGDPVPSLPPKVDTGPGPAPPAIASAPANSSPAPTASDDGAPAGTAPAPAAPPVPSAPKVPSAPATTDRGQRVWPPPPATSA